MNAGRSALTCAAILGVGLGAKCPPPNGPNCDSMVTYDAKSIDADVKVKNWAAAKLDMSTEVLRDVNEAFTSLDQEYVQACRMYEAGAMSAGDFQSVMKEARDRERNVRLCLSLADKGESASAYRNAMQCLHETAVPAEKRDELAINLMVQAMKAGASGPITMTGGETLHTGDKMVFGVKVSKPAHVYLVQRTGPERRLEVLFPNADIASVQNPLPAGQLVRLPPKGQSFKVNDKDIGLEEVFVIASEKPLGDLGSALESLRAGGGAGQETFTEEVTSLFEEGAPDCAGKTRGLETTSDDCPLTRGVSTTPETLAEDPFFAGEAVSMGARAQAWDDTILQVFSFQHEK